MFNANARTALAALLASLALAACATPAPPSAAPAPSPPPAAASPLTLEEIPAEDLKVGQCALVLWTRSQPTARVFFAVNAPQQEARIKLSGRKRALAFQEADGELIFGHAASTIYTDDALTLTTRLQIEPRSGLVGGALAPEGVLELKDQAGWSAIIPVSGLIACAPNR